VKQSFDVSIFTFTISIGGIGMSFHLSCPRFGAGETIPREFTGEGADHSPPLNWTYPPAGTQSFALVCEDPDAPRGTWIHWVLFNIPAEQRSLEEHVPALEELPTTARHGITDFKTYGYGGPAPPPGKPHRYFFRLYALDSLLKLPAGSTRSQLTAEMNGHILGEATLMGVYKR
jgi:Raf kinase inhibitor-like YbhB/YbcL family protein